MLFARRDADCRYVMERRKSPCEVLMSVSMTVSGTSMFSALAMEASRAEVEASSSGLKRNFEHREARGSMILEGGQGAVGTSAQAGSRVKFRDESAQKLGAKSCATYRVT